MKLPAAFEPLRQPVFRGLWLAYLAANMTMWMNDVAAAWLMTSLTTSPVMVAWVSAAATLPVFLLGLPSGALADILDRRRFLAATQLWVSLVALVLAAVSASGAMTAPVLLALTFAHGMGLALRWPVFSAIVPQVVPREQLSQALALNGVSMNLSRLVGPVVAGGLIATVSPAAVFALNAVLAVVSFTLILRWRAEPRASTLPGERFVGAMRVGLNYAMQSVRLKGVLLRTFIFFLQSAGLSALLPLVARELHGGGPATFTLMLSCLGAGAIVAALQFPRWRARFDRDEFVRVGIFVHAVMSTLIVVVQEVWFALPAMVVVGMAWISVANSLAVSAQTALPDWVRARGMALYQVCLMGGVAAGALLWGQVAAWSSVPAGVGCAAVVGVLGWVFTRRWRVQGDQDIDLSPAPVAQMPPASLPIEPEEGPVMVTIEYQIDPVRANAFAAVMRRTRGARLRQGVLSWGLFRDAERPGHYIEYFVDENWIEHQRRLERFTAFDAELRAQRLAFHIGPEPPVLRRYVADAHVPSPAPPA